MQLLGSIIAALAIVAVTIAIVTAQLGPFAEDDGGGGDRQEQEFDRDSDNSGSGGGDEN